MKSTTINVLAAALLSAICVAAPQASAATILRNTYSQAAANCQSALPTFDGNIRKRPKALANEGSSNAFITCAFENTIDLVGTVTRVQVIVTNRAAADQNLTCTLVDGFGDSNFSTAVTKTVVVGSGGQNRAIWRSTDDNGGAGYTFPAVSCNLLPGMEITGTTLQFNEEIGS